MTDLQKLWQQVDYLEYNQEKMEVVGYINSEATKRASFLQLNEFIEHKSKYDGELRYYMVMISIGNKETRVHVSDFDIHKIVDYKTNEVLWERGGK